MNCQGLDCRSTELIKAHILPAGFGRLIRAADGKNIKIAGNRVAEANPQLGEFDPAILCEKCDNVLGLDDEYALDVSRRFKPIRAANEQLFVDTTVDCERFTRFALSVIWRASISKRKVFSEISLGPYENVSRDILFGTRPVSDFRQFELVVSRFTSEHLDTSSINYYPMRFKYLELNSYGFCVAGFRLLAKIDNRKLPSEYAPLIINRENVFRGAYLTFEECQEFKGLKEAVAANDRRAKGP